MSKKITDWHKLEEAVTDFLRARQRQTESYFHRFYDTRSAGSSLPPQPSDFLFIHRGRAHFIEAKFSQKNHSLSSCFAANVDPGQLASAHLVHRARADYYFLFYSLDANLFEVWGGEYCYSRYREHLRLEKNKCKRFETLESAILGGILNGHRSSVQ